MMTRIVLLPIAAALLFAGASTAQADDAERLREIEAREIEATEQMREAEKRLEEAARRIAELSAERLGQMGDAMHGYTFQISDKPRLGVNIENEGQNTPVEGVKILSVSPGSAAADAGLKADDVITAVNGDSMSASSGTEAIRRLLDFMQGVEEGDKLELEYLRGGNVGKVEVEPRKVEQSAFAWMPDGHNFRAPNTQVTPQLLERHRFAMPWRGSWGDMELVELTEGLGRYFGTESGLLVISAPKSNAYQLQEGDVIQSIDGREPSSVNHCMRILGSYQPGEKIELKIMRDKRRATLDIEMPDDRSSLLRPDAPRPVKPTRMRAPFVTPKPTERT